MRALHQKRGQGPLLINNNMLAPGACSCRHPNFMWSVYILRSLSHPAWPHGGYRKAAPYHRHGVRLLSGMSMPRTEALPPDRMPMRGVAG